MDTTTLILLAIVVLTLVLGIALLVRILRELRKTDDGTGLVMLQGQVDALREQVRLSLESGRLEIDRRLEQTQAAMHAVQRGLGEVDRQVRTVNEAAKDLRGLQELLRSPNARGGMGELLLTDLLAQVLPQAHYSVQYEFSGKERVDAVLRVGEALVPVDAKFPLDNFQRLRKADGPRDEAAARRAFRSDVRRHVEAISRRYIRPDEGTYEFGLMYIPSEAVYQEVIQQQGDDGLDLFHYALSRQVVPVSPQSFYAYLQVIVMGLRGLTIEQRAREIMDRLGGLRKQLDRFSESFELASRHLGHAQRQLDEGGRRLARLDESVASLTSGAHTELEAEERRDPQALNH